MSDEMPCYELYIEYPYKVGPDQYDPNIKNKVKTIRPSSLHGYVSGEDKMKLDDEMADECWNSINTAMNKGKERGFIKDQQKPTETSTQQVQEVKREVHHDTGQSSLDAKETRSTGEGYSGDYPPSEAQKTYLERLRNMGVKHHDRAVSYLSEHNKVYTGELDKRQTSELISLLKDIKED